jgi:hypothetical protein
MTTPVDYPASVLDGVADATAIPSLGAPTPKETTTDDASGSDRAEKSAAVAGVPSDDDDVDAPRFAPVGGNAVACDLPAIGSPDGSLATTNDGDPFVKTSVVSCPSPPTTGTMEPPIEIMEGETGEGAAMIRALGVKPSPENGTHDDVNFEGSKDAKRVRIFEEESNGKDLDGCLQHLNEVRLSLPSMHSVSFIPLSPCLTSPL